MIERFRRSWVLTKQSWHVLRSDTQLVVFPILSSIACLIVTASFFVPLLATTDWQALTANDQGGEIRLEPLHYVLLFLMYFVTYFVMAFFNSALIACAMRKFDGEEPTIGFGLKAAAARLPQLLAWSAVNATVGMVLRMISERSGVLGKIVIGLIGMVWTIATFFVVPVLVMEGVGPIKAIKRSGAILNKVWGESLVAQVGTGLVLALIGFLGFFAIAGVGVGLTIATGSAIPVIVGGVIAILFLVLMGLIGSTLKMILVAACYRYAATGTIPESFDGDSLRSMFRPKKQRD